MLWLFVISVTFTLFVLRYLCCSLAVGWTGIFDLVFACLLLRLGVYVVLGYSWFVCDYCLNWFTTRWFRLILFACLFCYCCCGWIGWLVWLALAFLFFLVDAGLLFLCCLF